ncbi:MAG TPA: dihydrofolate reductase family protein [Pseudonocardiaceae bacterium]|nr:dihydrofolate reductase family protein [Pseudonocardiaceae bacterium]
MRRIINSTYISVDGVIKDPHLWPASGREDVDFRPTQWPLLDSSDALLMGRHTYDAFAPAWTSRGGDPFSDKMNNMPKYVASTTLTDPKWNNTTVLGTDAVEQIRRLKAEPGGNIVQYGFGQLSYALMARGLLDELRLWIHPVFVGGGGPDALLYRQCPTTKLDHVRTETFKNGIVILTYHINSV